MSEEPKVDQFVLLNSLRDDEYIIGIYPVSGAIFCATNRRTFRFKNDRWEETKFWTLIGSTV